MSMEMETEDQPVAMAHQQDSENSFGQKAAESPGFPPRVESPPAHKASAPSPTINTKEAMAEVMAMFGTWPPLHCRCVQADVAVYCS